MLNEKNNPTSQNKNFITSPIPGVMNNNFSTTPVAAPFTSKKSSLKYILGGLLLVLLLVSSGVGLYLTQQQQDIRQEAFEASDASCSLSFDVATPLAGISCLKTAYQDELSNTAGEYELTTQ